MSPSLTVLRRCVVTPLVTVTALGAVALSGDSTATEGDGTTRVASFYPADVDAATAADEVTLDLAGGVADDEAGAGAAGRGADARRDVSRSASGRTAEPVRRRPLAPEHPVLPVRDFEITGTFAASGAMWSSEHTGTDFAAPYGTPVRAVEQGRVVSVGYDGAFGLKVVVRGDDGTRWWFCHLAEAAVRPGQRVEAGGQLGAIGTTGNTTGPHLHLEVHRGGRTLDPAAWLARLGLRV